MLWRSAIVAATAAGRGGVLSPKACAFSDDITLESLRREQCAFVEERDWQQFHTPRSLALAMVGEVGEVCELLQWRGDEGAKRGLPGWTTAEKTALADELADVLAYVIRLSDVTGIDLSDAFLTKLRKNEAKYPADQVRGSAAKYTEYRQRARGLGGAVTEAAASSQATVTDDAETKGEWGTPQRIEDAYRRAAARVYGDEAAVPASAPPSSPRPASSAASPSGSANAKPNPRQRAAAKVDQLLEERRNTDQGKVETRADEPTATRPENSTTGDKEKNGRTGGVEVDSLDELWGLMEFGEPY